MTGPIYIPDDEDEEDEEEETPIEVPATWPQDPEEAEILEPAARDVTND